MKRIFLDSSVLFSATNSPTGGSAKLFTLRTIKLYTSPVVLAEVERNVRKKLHVYHLSRWFILAKQLTILDQMPDPGRIKKACAVIVSKDAVILAEAKMSKCIVLATLDRRHFMNEKVTKFLQPMQVMSPKEIIETVA